MKKIIAAAAGLMLAGTVATAASAVESQFGGYFHAIGATLNDIDGEDSGSISYAVTRTRLYYTAVFNENLKFVNKFEIDYFYGDDIIGDIGADGKGQFEIKNSYIDFNTNNLRFKIGTQYAEVARGFLFANDFSGVYVGSGVGDNVLLQAVWIKVVEDEDELITPAGEDETDLYAFVPVFTLSDSLSVTPYIHYANVEGSDGDSYFVGADVDFSTDAFSVWGTGIYNGGEMANGDDVKAWLLAAGGSAGMFHGEVFYATGDDDTGDGDEEAFAAVAPGQSYVWAEILGEGDMWKASALTPGSPITNPSNILAANVGVTAKVAEKLTLYADLWWAQLAEDNDFGEDDLGVEVDLKASYMIMDNLKLDLIGAYLFTGDAYDPTDGTGDGDADEDAMEIGARISLSF